MKKLIDTVFSIPLLFAVVVMAGFLGVESLFSNVMGSIKNDVVYAVIRCSTDVALITAFTLWLKRKIGEPFVLGVTTRRLGKAFLLIWAEAIALAINFGGLSSAFARLDPNATSMQMISAYVSGFLSGLRPGIVEELICRACVMGGLMHMWARKPNRTVSAVILSALLFGMAHLVNIPDQGLSRSLFQCLHATASGMLYGAVYARTRNIVAPIVVHSLTDIIAIIAEKLPVVADPAAAAAAANDGPSAVAFVSYAVISGFWISISLFLLRKKKRHEVEALWKVELPAADPAHQSV